MTVLDRARRISIKLGVETAGVDGIRAIEAGAAGTEGVAGTAGVGGTPRLDAAPPAAVMAAARAALAADFRFCCAGMPLAEGGAL